nr:hypothetical protein [uncultured Bacteroides sp.]
MKKTFVDIKEVASFNSLYNGYMRATEGKKKYRKDVKPYEQNLSVNLKNLSRKLLNESWKPSEGHTFMLFTEGKWREINTQPIEDRIVHQSLVYYWGTILENDSSVEHTEV